MGKVIIGYKRWRRQGYLLDMLSLRELVKAYFTYPAIQVYLLLAAISGGMALYNSQGLQGIPLLRSAALSAVLVVLIYPFAWYLLHLAHHFHSERSNYGITNFLWDRMLATYYRNPAQMPRSCTVRDLGYAGAETERYPWVAELTEATSGDALAKQDHGAV